LACSEKIRFGEGVNSKKKIYGFKLKK